MKFNTDYLFGSTQIKQMKLGRMTAKEIAVHNTANTAPAINEAKNMYNNNTLKGANGVAVHFFVDDEYIYQMLPLDIHGWHAGDGANGVGNKQSIAIEICASKDYYTDRYIKAELKAVELVKYLMKKHNIPINKVKRHYDYATNKKRCPHRMFETKPNTWQQFLNLVTKPADTTIKPPIYIEGGYKVGDTVNFTKLANKSTKEAKVINAYYKTGKITKIYKGTAYPYLVNDYLGFLNADMIENKPTVAPKTKPVTNKYQTPAGSYKESARFTNTSGSSIHMRQYVPNVNGVFNGKLAPNAYIDYQDVYWGNGYLWVGNGVTWVPTAKIDSNKKLVGKAWGTYKAIAKAVAKIKVGDTVTFGRIATQSNGGKEVSSYYKNGVVNKIYANAKYPYEIKRDGVLIGYVNDGMIKR